MKLPIAFAANGDTKSVILFPRVIESRPPNTVQIPIIIFDEIGIFIFFMP